MLAAVTACIKAGMLLLIVGSVWH